MNKPKKKKGCTKLFNKSNRNYPNYIQAMKIICNVKNCEDKFFLNCVTKIDDQDDNWFLLASVYRMIKFTFKANDLDIDNPEYMNEDKLRKILKDIVGNYGR